MTAKQAICRAARELREQSLLLEVYHGDERMVVCIAEKINLINQDLDSCLKGATGRLRSLSEKLRDKPGDHENGHQVAEQLMRISHELVGPIGSN